MQGDVHPESAMQLLKAEVGGYVCSLAIQYRPQHNMAFPTISSTSPEPTPTSARVRSLARAFVPASVCTSTTLP